MRLTIRDFFEYSYLHSIQPLYRMSVLAEIVYQGQPKNDKREGLTNRKGNSIIVRMRVKCVRMGKARKQLEAKSDWVRACLLF